MANVINDSLTDPLGVTRTVGNTLGIGQGVSAQPGVGYNNQGALNITSARGVRTGAGIPDYFVYTTSDGRTFSVSADIARDPYDVIGGNTVSANSPQLSSVAKGMDANAINLENKFFQKFGEAMPETMFQDIKKNPTSAYATNLQAGIDSNAVKYDRNTQSVYYDTPALEGKTDAELQTLKDLGLVNPEQIAEIASAKTKAELEANKYKFEMPTEFQTIEDQANATIAAGTPTLDPNLVSSWQTKLEEAYAPTRDKLKRNMADYWAALFPQGGGSGKQATANMGQLSDLEIDKLNRSIGFAESDMATKLAQFQNAQNILQGIGGVKVQAGQFGSAQDAATALANAQLAWQQQKAAMDQQNALTAWNKQSELAKYLAELQRPKQMDFASQLGTGLVNNIGPIMAALV